MPCERMSCAQCRTVLALKNDAPCVGQFLNNSDKSKPLDPYVVISSDALQTWVIQRCLRPKLYGKVKAHLLADSADPHLVFQEVIMEHPRRRNGYGYQISPLYTIIQGCSWLSPHILSSIISANLVDPPEVHGEVMIRFLVSDRFAVYWSATKRNAVSMFTSMHCCA